MRARVWIATAVAAALAVLASGCAPPSPPPIVRGADGPLPVRFYVEPLLEQLLDDPTAAPPGANDFDCEPSDAHPRPVILVHGLIVTQAFWQTLSPLLANNGYCVFTLTYGSHPGIPQLGGLIGVDPGSWTRVVVSQAAREAA